MKQSLFAIPLLAAAALQSAYAAPQTSTLSVPDMDCSTCPITVRKALTNVAGVTRAEASLEKKQAVVTYDDAKTSVDALIKATTNAGYPSSVKK